ncbi:MarR family winged helix-turn-helix transcriptional regulator [Streptomyces sp. SYP-A7185]|uniref:MarR family winged helix-turn-helix transcriptional regulator n=1 Tax=Streptomyces sp. SYP-A7185 TaxID=3040076 RepID=UPI0038F819CA
MDDAPPRWLDPEEKAAWDSFIRMQEKLIGRLARRVQADSGMSAADYIVLVSLTERGEGRMRFLDLAKLVEWEKSRMSHQVTRMAKRGLVVREECPDDGRGAFIVATPAGHRAIEEAAPQHVEHVRRLFIDALTPHQLATLGRLSQRVLDHMERQPD